MPKGESRKARIRKTMPWVVVPLMNISTDRTTRITQTMLQKTAATQKRKFINPPPVEFGQVTFHDFASFICTAIVNGDNFVVGESLI